MALTGLQIYKLLPKTNCRECGFPTCLAFAMQLAQKKVELSKCPYVSEEAKRVLEAESGRNWLQSARVTRRLRLVKSR